MRIKDFMYEFEAVLEAPVEAEGEVRAGGLAPPPAAAVPAPAAVEEPVVPAPAAAAEPLTREEIITAAREAAMEGSGDAFRTMIAKAEADEQARRASIPTALPEWDPYDPQVVMTHIVSGLTPLLRSIEAAVQETRGVTQEYTKEQGKAEAMSLLDGLKTGDDALEFNNEDAISRARLMLVNDPRIDPEEALKQAAKDEAAHTTKIELALLDRLGIVAENHLRIAPEPGSGAAAAGEEPLPLPRGKAGYEEQIRRSLAARGTGPGIRAA